MKKLSKKTRRVLLWGVVILVVLGLIAGLVVMNRKADPDNNVSARRMGKKVKYTQLACAYSDSGSMAGITTDECNACLTTGVCNCMAQGNNNMNRKDMLSCCNAVCDTDPNSALYNSCDSDR